MKQASINAANESKLSHKYFVHFTSLSIILTLWNSEFFLYLTSRETGIYFFSLLIREQLMATNKPSKIHGNAAPKKSLIILHSSFKISIFQYVKLEVTVLQ